MGDFGGVRDVWGRGGGGGGVGEINPAGKDLFGQEVGWYSTPECM